MRPIILLSFIFCCLIFSLGPAVAAAPASGGPQELGPKQTARYMALLPQLRCMQCQNESLASSQAPWAAQVRQHIRQLIVHGDTDQQIKNYLVARYGEYVLYRPPFQPSTWALWLVPFALLALGVAALLLAMRFSARRRRTTSDSTLSQVRHWLESDKP